MTMLMMMMLLVMVVVVAMELVCGRHTVENPKKSHVGNTTPIK